MNEAKKRANMRGLILLLGSMTTGGCIGYVFASGAVVVPENFSLNPSIYYEYDIMFGCIALLSLLLAVLTVLGLVQTRRMKDEPKSDGEIHNLKEKALSRVMQFSYYTMIITLLWLVMSFAHALGPGGKESEDAPFMMTNMITALVFMLFSFTY